MDIQYRWANASDYIQLGEVIFDAVRNGRSLYNEPQRNAWVEAPRHGTDWENRLATQSIATACSAETIIGFMSLTANGYLDFAYIRPAFQGTGIFRQLYGMIFSLAKKQKNPSIWLHASLMAQPAFQAMGFQIIKEEKVQLNGLDFDRFEMQLLLAE